ncbi:MAG: hypothetical protein GX600_08655 [Dehalococcoidia bacterium]|nr:hypothetical protein [Dehalococcoidia bacterium]
MARRLVSSVVIFGVVLSSVLVAILPSSQVLAQFEALRWTPIRTPSDEDFFAVTPSEVSALVLGSESVWYAADIPNSSLYRTLDGGRTWDDEIEDALLDATPTPTLPVWDLAVAPDDPDFIVAVTDGRQEVYVSQDGGDSWEALPSPSTAAEWVPGHVIADVAVSPLYGDNEQRDVAVGIRLPNGAADGDVIVIQLDTLIGSWRGQGLDADVSRVAFSPNYDDDETIIALVSDTTGTFLATGYRVIGSNTTLWEVTNPYYIEISHMNTGALSPREDQLIYSDIVVPPDYDGDNASKRVVYVSYASTVYLLGDPNEIPDDVYRVAEPHAYRMNLKQGGNAPVFSIAYRDGTVLAGEVAADAAKGRAWVHFCDEPDASFPDWYEPEKRPSAGFGTGVGNAIVAYTPSGEWAVCGTSTNSVTTPAEWADVTLPGPWSGAGIDESAVSRAARGDDYSLWNQISLIDTDIAQLCDYVLWLVGTVEEEPGNTMFLASVGAGMDSIWRSTALTEEDLGTLWQRVDFLDTPTDDIIMRRTPETGSDSATFYAVRDSQLLYRSVDEGQTWDRIHECPEDVTDVAIVSSERIYVLYDNLLAIGQWTKVRDWHVWQWEYDIDTGLKSGSTLLFHGNSYIFAGDDGEEGEIAISTNGGDSFTVLPPLPLVGRVHMTLDNDFARNKLLYAATDNNVSGIYRWTVGAATDWEPLNPPNGGFSALASSTGVLYGAFGQGVDRTLIPRAPNITVMDWDSLTVGLTAGTDFRSDTLRVTVNDVVNLWALDDRNYDYEAEEGRLWVYGDTFVLPTPWPVTPALGEVVPCDICDCEACPFCFEWKPMPKAVRWDLWVALDEQFKYVLLKLEDVEPWCCDTPGVCYFEIPMSFDCGSTYYWRIRATGTTENERVHSRWSPPMHFLVAAGSTVESMHVAPILVTPGAGALGVNRTPGFSWTGFPSTTVYEFQLTQDNTFRSLLDRVDLDRTAYVYPGNLEPGATYFWRVRALTPHPSEWTTSSFTVLPQVAPQVVPEATILDARTASPWSEATPLWIWVLIAALALLVICILTYILVDRRR